jgi:hypothetical protein
MISSVDGAAVVSQIHLFVSHRSPISCNENVVSPASPAVHADFDLVVPQHSDEIATGKLATLVRIHDFRDAVFGNLLAKRHHTELGRHRVWELPSWSSPPHFDRTVLP